MKRRYDFIEEVDDSKFIKVILNKKVGIIDQDENEIIPPIFKEVYIEDNNFFRVVNEDRLGGLYNNEGKEVLMCKYKGISVYKTELVNSSGTIAIVTNNLNLRGVYDGLGNIICPEEYNEIELCDDCLIVCKDGLYGALDFNKNVNIPIEYDRLIKCTECLVFLAKKKELCGAVDKNNKPILPIDFQEIRAYKGGIHVKKIDDGGEQKNIFYKYDGELISELNQKIIDVFNNELCIFVHENKYGLMDIHGKIILKPFYEKIEFKGYLKGCSKIFLQVTPFCCKGVAIFDSDGKNITGFGCDYAMIYNEYIIACKNGKYGVCDVDGNVIVPFEYRFIDCFDNNGFAQVWIGDDDIKAKIGLVNKKGERVLDCIYDKIIETHEKYAKVSYNMRNGIARYK